MIPETFSTEEQIHGPPPVCIVYCCVYSHDAVQASGTSYPKADRFDHAHPNARSRPDNNGQKNIRMSTTSGLG